MDTPGARWLAIWDRPVRIIHWSIVLLMPALWWTWRADQMALHKLLGYLALGLIVFRLYWGLVGSGTARFAGFVRAPAAVWRYATGRGAGADGAAAIGHNPLGGWSVIALLVTLLVQLASGLITQDVDGVESGPLAYLVAYDTADRARGWHGISFDVLLGLIALHVAAVLFHVVVKRTDLVTPMLTGRRAWTGDGEAPANAQPRWRAVPGAVGAGLLAWWVSRGCPL